MAFREQVGMTVRWKGREEEKHDEEKSILF